MPMNEELKALIAAVQEKFEKSQEGRIKAEKEISDKLKALDVKYEKFEKSQDSTEIKNLKSQIAELENEISDVRTKAHQPVVIEDEHKQKLHEKVFKPIIGKWLRGKSEGTAMDLMVFVKDEATAQCKSLNITNPDEGGRAIAQVLSRDVIEYAREYSPILGQVGRKPGMTRNFRELVLVTYPSVQEGIENVAGTTITETTTQEYREVASKVFKVNAKPRITDEAMFAPDVDLYGQLIRLLGREIAIYLSAQVLYGNGTGKNARGILSSKRVDITNTTGKSWKPTLAADPDNARDADYYPAYATGVSGSLGTDDEAIVNLIIDIINTLPTQWLVGAKWHMNRKTKGVIEKVRDANNLPIFKTSYREGGMPMLNGYPIVIDDTLPSLAADSTPIIFGNLSAAYAINDGDIDKLLLDPYTVDGCTVVKQDKEMIEIVQNSDAIIVVAATTNGA